MKSHPLSLIILLLLSGLCDKQTLLSDQSCEGPQTTQKGTHCLFSSSDNRLISSFRFISHLKNSDGTGCKIYELW